MISVGNIARKSLFLLESVNSNTYIPITTYLIIGIYILILFYLLVVFFMDVFHVLKDKTQFPHQFMSLGNIKRVFLFFASFYPPHMLLNNSVAQFLLYHFSNTVFLLVFGSVELILTIIQVPYINVNLWC